MRFPAVIVTVVLAASSAAGAEMEYSTYLGGSGNDVANALALDASGRAHILGTTFSADLATTERAVQPDCGSDGLCDDGRSDVFAARLSSDGSRVEMLTYLGGSRDETAKFVRVDRRGGIYIAGSTRSSDFPFSTDFLGPARSDFQDFVAKLSPGGDVLEYAIPLPNFTLEGMDVDSLGQLWIMGRAMRQMPVTHPGTTPTPLSAYLAAIDPTGSRVVFSTFWGGGGGSDILGGIGVGPDDAATVCGVTGSGSFPQRFGTLGGPSRVPHFFLFRFRMTGELVFSKVFGGSGNDGGGCVIDSSGSAHYYGSTSSPDFPWSPGQGPQPTDSVDRPLLYARITADGLALAQAKAFPGNSPRPQLVGIDGNSRPWFVDGFTVEEGSLLWSLRPDGSATTRSVIPLQANMPGAVPLAFDRQGGIYVVDNAREWQVGRQATPGAAHSSPLGENDVLVTKLSPGRRRLIVEPPHISIQTNRPNTAVRERVRIYLSAAGAGRSPLTVAIRAEHPAVELPVLGTEILIVNAESTGRPTLYEFEVAPPSEPGVLETALIFESPDQLAAPVRVPIRVERGEEFNAATRDPIVGEYVIGTPTPVEIPLGIEPYPVAEQTVEIEVSRPWASVRPATFSNSWQLDVDPAGLVPGVHRAELAMRVAGSPQATSLPILFYVREPAVRAGPGVLQLIAQAGTTEPSTGEVLADVFTHVRPGVSGPPVLRVASITANQPWLSATIAERKMPGVLRVSANPAGLAPGRYYGTVLIQTAEPMAPLPINVTFSVVDRVKLSANPASLAVAIPSPEMVGGVRRIRLESAEPRAFRILPESGLLDWIEPTEGITPTEISVRIEPLLPVRHETFSILVESEGSVVRIPLAFSVRQLRPVATALTNAASFREGYVSPGSLATIFGEQLTVTNDQATTLPLPTQMGAISAELFAPTTHGTPFLFISPGQANIQIPAAPPGPATLRIRTSGSEWQDIAFEIAEAAPGIFTFGENRAVVQNQDGSVNTPDSPAQAGSIGVLYLTGQGPLDQEVEAGQPAPASPLARATLPVELRVGGQAAEVLFAGLAPGYVGLCQVNFRFPELAAGDHSIQIRFGTAGSNLAVVSVR